MIEVIARIDGAGYLVADDAYELLENAHIARHVMPHTLKRVALDALSVAFSFSLDARSHIV
jgi:hypothetical protein